MYSRLVIDGNAVYEIDEECVQKKKNRGYKAGKRRGEERKEEIWKECHAKGYES